MSSNPDCVCSIDDDCCKGMRTRLKATFTDVLDCLPLDGGEIDLVFVIPEGSSTGHFEGKGTVGGVEWELEMICDASGSQCSDFRLSIVNSDDPECPTGEASADGCECGPDAVHIPFSHFFAGPGCAACASAGGEFFITVTD